jgi:hypothetical protein
MFEKLLGYLLLFLGLVTIILAAYNAFDVFTGKNSPPRLFSQTGISIDLKTLAQNLGPQVAAPPEDSSRLEVLSSTTVNDLLNLTAYLILVSIISAAGFKVASLGVMLIRTIEVKVLENTPMRVAQKISEGGNPPT